MAFNVLILFLAFFLAYASQGIKPSITVDSMYGKTRGSRIYPFACYKYPTLSTPPNKTWPAGTQRQIELNCWTRPIPSWQGAKAHNISWQFSQYDNDIFWFHSEKEECWFPDYVVQKDAAYGPPMNTPLPYQTIVPSADLLPTLSSSAASGQLLTIPPTSPQIATATSQYSQAGNPAVPNGPSSAKGPGGRPGYGDRNPQWPWLLQELLARKGPAQADDLKERVRFCPQPSFEAATFRPQYTGQSYCYENTRLEAVSRKIKLNPARLVELGCWKIGDIVEEDPVWWKIVDEHCYIPNQVFEPASFQGNAGECR